MHFVPPPNISKNKYQKSLISTAMLLALGSFAHFSYAITDLTIPSQPTETVGNYVFNFEEFFGKDVTEDSLGNINISIAPKIEWNYYTFRIGTKKLTIEGDTFLRSISTVYQKGATHPGTYAFEVDGDTKEGTAGSIHFKGNVDAVVIHTKEADIPKEDVTSGNYVGANMFYAKNGGVITIGEEGKETFTRAWAIGPKPDLISVKNGGKVVLHSKHNQLVGNIDTLEEDFGTKGSTVTATFSDSDSYWFGDEQTFHNFDKITASVQGAPLPIEIKSNEDLNNLLSKNYDSLWIDGTTDEQKKDATKTINQILAALVIENKPVTETIDLTFENGAQWTYFGDKQILSHDKSFGEENNKIQASVTFESTPKRISSIRLNGGIINLYDEDIQKKWEAIGLTEAWADVNIKHDYVRVGDLKGNAGIFRLDLDSDDQQNSDMVFIESSSTGGTHFVEPYRPEDLASVSDSNRLTFALVASKANNISFADKQNIYGNSLFDYEMYISQEKIDDSNKDELNDLITNNYADFENFNIEDFIDGTHWFINRLQVKESAAAIGMRSAGYASYDLAVSMDRRDRRLHDAVFQNEKKDGLWTRIQYGEAGAEHLYNADLTTVYVGYEKATSLDNRLGFSFGYTDGDSDFSDLKGSGELKRYEASVYDTLTFGSHYLDFVARFGQVENDFDVTNQVGTLTTSGSFDQKYAALSAEYGYNFKDEHNVFIEPQVQLQVAYLGDYDYRTERNMKVEADNDISVIGRVGLRTGKAFESADYAGELYARADVLHQFTDGQDADFSDLSHKVGVTWGDKDTWSTFGVGGYLNWKDNMSFQVDVERTAGGETTDTWLVSGRFNYLF